ncbi:MAG: hypothetical protein IID46_04630 [Planctomycetes bacterium]|nr:hypothetical protein [Planctomycetota bacterium]
MSRKLSETILLAGMVSLVSTTLFGQEFRVYTAVYDVSASNNGKAGKQDPVFRSLTLFHAGKVYDYISAIGEVTIFEPAHSRFTILSTSRKLATTVDIDEINHKLKTAEEVVKNRITELRQKNESKFSALQAALQFQLDPDFEETYLKEAKQLTLRSPNLQYVVQCADPKSQKAIAPENVTAYLRYADWICRLNYVLHPGALLPPPRLALNESLRRRNLIPTQVELKAAAGAQINLRAEHKIQWELTKLDRSLIDRWETMLRSKKTRDVPFRRYQETVLAGNPKQRR